MKPRRRFRFSLRTFFVLLTLFGVWLGVQVKWVKDRHAASVSEGQLGLRDYAFEMSASAPWSIRWLGEPGYRSVIVYRRDDYHLTPEELDAARRAELLFPEAEIQYMKRPYDETQGLYKLLFPPPNSAAPHFRTLPGLRHDPQLEGTANGTMSALRP